MNTPLRLERFACEFFYQAIFKQANAAGAQNLTMEDVERYFKRFLDAGFEYVDESCYYHEPRKCIGRYAREQAANYVVRLDRFTTELRRHGAKLNVLAVAETLAKQVAIRAALEGAPIPDSDVAIINAKIKRSGTSNYYMAVRAGTKPHMFFPKDAETKVLSLKEAQAVPGLNVDRILRQPYVGFDFRAGFSNGRTARLPEAARLLIK